MEHTKAPMEQRTSFIYNVCRLEFEFLDITTLTTHDCKTIEFVVHHQQWSVRSKRSLPNIKPF